VQDTIPVLNGKTTLVTGAAKRIGAHIVTALHVAGMNVVLHYRNSWMEGEALNAALNARHDGSVVTVKANLLQLDVLSQLLKAAASS
jgi:pteridine reductase